MVLAQFTTNYKLGRRGAIENPPLLGRGKWPDLRSHLREIAEGREDLRGRKDDAYVAIITNNKNDSCISSCRKRDNRSEVDIIVSFHRLFEK